MDLTLAYPGLWITPGIYATHGRYLDCISRCLAWRRGVAAALAPVTAQPPATGRPNDYEAVLALCAPSPPAVAAPVGAGDTGGTSRLSSSIRAHGYRRLRGEPTCALAPGAGGRRGSEVVGALGVLRLAGLGLLQAEVTPAEMGRAGRAAMGEVVRRFGIEARH